MFGRFFRAVAFGIICLAAFPSGAEMTFTVLAGAGGYVRPEAVTPVQVIVKNDETERDGRISVAFLSSMELPFRWVSHVLPLPPSTQKSIFLYLPPDEDPARIVVRYETLRGKKVAESREPVKVLEADTPVVGAVGLFPRGLPSAQVDGRLVYHHLILQPNQLPDRYEGLGMFDALVLSPPPVDELALDRVEALRGWVLRGGTLVVDASRRTQALADGPLLELLPFLPRAGAQITPAVFQKEVVVSTGDIVDGETLLESDGYPLVVRRNYGLGSVVCFAFDPDLPAFALEYPGRAALWDEILGGLNLKAVLAEKGNTKGSFIPPSYDPNRAWRPNGFAASMTALVTAPPQAGLRLGLVLLFMVLYALAVGPGDYSLVRRLGKPSLTWVTFPIIVAGFTFCAYVGARVWIGGGMESRNVERMLILEDQKAAVRYDLVSLFAPEGKDYALHVRSNGILQPIRERVFGGSEERFHMEQDTGTLVHRIPIWTYRTYGVSETTQSYPDVGLTVERQGDALIATVKNDSDLTLMGASLLYGSEVLATKPGNGAIVPGETVSVRCGAADKPPSTQSTVLGSDVLSGTMPFRAAPLAEAREFDIRDALRRGAVVFYSGDAGVAPSPLEVDGRGREEEGRRALLVVTYEESQE